MEDLWRETVRLRRKFRCFLESSVLTRAASSLPAQNRAKAGAFAYSRYMLTSEYASIYENERRRERFHPHR